MIPQHLQSKISTSLYEKFGIRQDIGDFLFKFSFAPVGHDTEYALDVLKDKQDNKELCEAINMVLSILTEEFSTQ